MKIWGFKSPEPRRPPPRITAARRIPGDRKHPIWSRWLRLNLIQVNQSRVPVNPADHTPFAKEPLEFLYFAKRSTAVQRSLHIGHSLYVFNPMFSSFSAQGPV
jgi:hypothetical protein